MSYQIGLIELRFSQAGKSKAFTTGLVDGWYNRWLPDIRGISVYINEGVLVFEYQQGWNIGAACRFDRSYLAKLYNDAISYRLEAM